jgi:muramoyltetrapeptide carboxypeptidase LdcA involved in peptidoglycan recycling
LYDGAAGGDVTDDDDAPTVAPPVSPGDRVAVLSPASGGGHRFPHPYERGCRLLRERFDLEPVAFPTATRSSEWLYDHPEARARDIERAFRDPDIGAVLATIGGNDQVRVLKHLDGDVLAANPTRFLGSSDNTHLHSLLWEAGVVSYYGGMVLTTLGTAVDRFPEASEWLARALFEETFGALAPAAEWTDDDPDWFAADYHETALEREPGEWAWRGGDQRAEGRLWGGCLEVLDTVLAADRTCPATDALAGSVLFLESSEELPGESEVRRMLLGMGERGVLGAVDAVLVGRPKARNPHEEPDVETRAAYREAQYDLVADVVAEYAPEVPVVCGVDVGHTYPTAPLPVGGRCVVDPAAERVTFPTR